MGPGASEAGDRLEAAPRSALGPGVSLHTYDIVVVVVYFVFVLAVGIWVSGLEAEAGQRDSGSFSSEAGCGSGQNAHSSTKSLQAGPPSIEGQTAGSGLPEITLRARSCLVYPTTLTPTSLLILLSLCTCCLCPTRAWLPSLLTSSSSKTPHSAKT